MLPFAQSSNATPLGAGYCFPKKQQRLEVAGMRAARPRQEAYTYLRLPGWPTCDDTRATATEPTALRLL